MIRRNASLLLAIAIIALGTAQASAELVHINPGTQSPNALINGAFPGVTLGVHEELYNVATDHVYAKPSSVSGMGQVFGWSYTSSPSTIAEEWNVTETYLEAVFANPVAYVEVDVIGGNDALAQFAELLPFYSETGGWPGESTRVRAEWQDSSHTELVTLAIDLSASLIKKIWVSGGHFVDEDPDHPANHFGESVFIKAIRYSVEPYDPPVVSVPEPASLVGLMLGAFASVVVRLRRR